jgi:hypothetical protein
MRTILKLIFITIVFLSLTNSAFGKKGDFTAAEEAGLKLMAMQQKGFIQLNIDEPSTFMQVEPLAWKGLMHKDKVNLVRTAIRFCSGLNQKGRKIMFVILQDMTSGKKLATGEVDRGRVDIYK